MSTSKTFTYPVTVVAYREPDKYAAGVAELYVNGKYLDWCTLDTFNVDMSHREALEEHNEDLIDLLEFDERGEIRDIKSGCEESFFEWAVTELVEGGYVTDTNLYFDCAMREAFGDNVSHRVGEYSDYSLKAGNGSYVIGFTLKSDEPLMLRGEHLNYKEAHYA